MQIQPKFAAKPSPQDIEQVKAWVREIPQLGEAMAEHLEPRISQRVDTDKISSELTFLQKLAATPEALKDVFRILRAEKKLAAKGKLVKALGIQWLHFSKPGDAQRQLEARRICGETGKCPVMEMYAPTDQDLLTIRHRPSL